MKHAQVVQPQLLVAGGDPAALLQPTHAAFDQVALTIRLVVERCRPRLVAAVCDDRCDATLLEKLADPTGGVSLVASELGGPVGHPVGVAQLREVLHQRDDVLGLVFLAGTDLDAQGQPLPLTDQVELGAEAAPAAAQGMVRPLAGGDFFFEPRPPPCGRGRRCRR